MAIIARPMGKGDDVQRAMLEVFETLPQSTRPEHARALAKLAKACGCAEGAVGALTFSAIILVRFFYSFRDFSLLDLLLLAGELLAAFLIGGFAGKFVGLAIARARFRRLHGRLLQEARIGAA